MKKLTGEVSFDRFKIPYRVYGDAEELIVCLSGAKQTMSAWRSFISHFQKQYKILVFDMPGQGRSEITSGSLGVSLSEQVEVLHQLLVHTGLDKIGSKNIIGGSWGSIVAAAYVESHPGVFQKAILGSFGTKANTVLNLVIDQVQQYIEAGKGKEIAPLMIEQFGQYIPETLQRQIISQFDSMTENQFLSFYEHSVFVTRMGDIKQHINLSKITIPTLVVMGQYDTIMDLFDTRMATQLMPNASFKLIKGAGHFLHWEQPEILEIYEEFFQNEKECACISVTN
jgi:pimeloyl-ACP methyl ester carboxylesterase